MNILTWSTSTAKSRRRRLHKKHGMIEKRLMNHDPGRKTVSVYRPGHRAERLSAKGVLEEDPVLPGYRLAVAEVFEWLKIRKSKPASRKSS